MKKINEKQLPEFKGFTHPAHSDMGSKTLQLTRNAWHWGHLENYPIYPYAFEEVERKNATWFTDKCNRYYLIVTVPKGEIRYYGNNKQFLLRPGNVLFIPQETYFSFKTTNNIYYKKISLFILGVNLSSIVESLNINQMRMITVPDIDDIIFEMRAVDSLLITAKRENMPELAARTIALLYRLSAMIPVKNENMMTFRMAKERLSSRFDSQFSIISLATELRVSPSTIERIFQKKLGIPPREYRIQSKMKYAKELLKNTNMSCKEISFELGYCNQFHFSNEFRRLNDISPRNFRKEHL
jgi:AraC-like DNA-binding protein/mannose-6-phosphate isomerase-like protein (cupin superfamily)